MIQSTASTALLVTRFQLSEQRLFFARARLYRECLEFAGWAGLKRYRRVIALEDIDEVKWRPGDGSTYNVTLTLSDGERVLLWLEGSGLWKYAIEQARGRVVEVRNGALPEEMVPASAA